MQMRGATGGRRGCLTEGTAKVTIYLSMLAVSYASNNLIFRLLMCINLRLLNYEVHNEINDLKPK
jgi:hypothetical protein